MKHTPGPWNISRDTRTIFASTDGAGVLIRGIEQTIPQIAYIASNGFAATFEEQKANARLIAAAPELLEAAQNLLDYVREFFPDEPLFSTDPHEQSVNVRDLEAAIRKAKGE